MMIYETNTLPEKIDSIDIKFYVNLSFDREDEMIFLFEVKVEDNEIRIETLSKHMMMRQYKLMGKDSLGNVIEYRISGGIDGNITFESSQIIPDVKCEWIELQLYVVETEMSFIRKNEIEDSEYTTEEYSVEEYIEEEYGQEWSEEDYKSIGEKVKIFIPM